MTRTRTAPMVSVSALALALSAGAAARIDAQWTNAAGGNWNVGTNWSTSPTFPNAAIDTATIGLITGATYTVTLNSAVSLGALTLNSADALLSHSAGTLNMNGGMITLTAGAYRLAGGTISNATISGAGLTTFGSTGSLSGVTLDTNLSLVNSYVLNINSGLVLNAGRTISLATGANFTNLSFLGAGDQSLSGGGEVVFDGTSSANGAVRATTGTLVIGAGTTIRSGTQGGAVGNQGSVRNHGTIASRTNARTITATAVTNEATGMLEASNGGTLTLAGAWSNAGTLFVDGGTLNLGGSFGTSSVAGARFDRVGGTVNITGTLTNTGNTLTLDADTGSFNLNGGTITGGTVTASGGSALTAAGTFGVLSGGVILDTGFSLINNYELRVNGGLTLNAGRTISLATGANFTTLDFLGAGDQTLSGGGEVVFDGTNSNNGQVRANSGSLVIGAGTTIRSGTQGGNVGDSGSVKNNGTIAARTAARTVTVNAVTNNATGVLEATNGGTLTLAGAWSNAGTFLVDTNGVLNLGGTFGTSSVAGSRFDRAGGTVNLTGSLANTGNTLTLDADTGSFNLSGGTITGGTVTASGGSALTAAGSFGVLSGGVTLDTGFSAINGYELRVNGGLTLNAGRTISLATGANFTVLDFLGAGDQTLAGGGEVVFDGSNSNNGLVRANSGSLVIGAGTTVRSGTQGGVVGQSGTVKNDGTIAARTAARTVTVNAVTNNATGVLEATNGGTLTMAGAWSNAGTFLINTNGILNLGGSFGTAAVAPARFNRTGGTVNLTGNLANTGNTLLLNAATGSFNLNGGTITGGTVAASGGAALNTVGGTSSLAGGVTLDTDLTLVNGATINVSGGLTVNAGRTVSLASGANFTILDFLGSGDQTLAGGGDVVFDGTSGSSGYVRANAGSLLIGAGTTVRSGSQGGNVGQSGTVKNNGTIAARTNARTITTTAVTNNATGVLEATNGGVLTLAGAWSNAGMFLLNGSTINLGGSFGTTAVAPARWNRTGGTVNLTGNLANTGATLSLDASTGSFNLSGGTITGGTVTTSGGAALNTLAGTSTLADGVTLDTNLTLVNNGTINVTGGLTVNTGRTVSLASGGNFTILDFLNAGDQSLAGGGDVVFDGTSSNTGYVRANAGALVIGAGTTVRSGTQGGNVGQSGTIKNNGTIAARTNARTLVATAVTNNATGVLEATNGGVLTLAGAWSNTGTFLLDSNPASTLNLGGTFGTPAVAPARWNRSGGAVNITGTLTNTGATLTLNAATGSFSLNGGTIAGGTVSGSGGSTLNTGGSAGSLTGGVTLDTDVALVNNYTLSVSGGLTINAGKTVSLNTGTNSTVLDLLGAGNQTITGAGQVVFDGTNNTNGFVRANSGTLVIDTGITVRTGAQGGRIGQLGSVTNKGVVSSQTAAKTITLTGTTLVNEGQMLASNGGTLTFDHAGGLSSNTGADLLARTGGTLRFNSGMNVANNGGFDLEIASASQTLGYGRIAITGNAAISGSDIDLILTGGFAPDWGDTFNILSFTTLTGDMSTLALPSLTDPMLRWWREQTASVYRVGVRHIADNNHDGVVDFLDLNRVLGTFGQAGMSLQGDGNEDGVVDFFDLNDVLSLFGQSAPPNPIPAPGALALFAGAAALRGSRRRR